MLLPHDREEASKLHPLLRQVFSYWARALPKKQQERSDEQKTLKMVAGDSQDDCALSSAITRPNILLFIFFFYIKYTCFPSFHPSFALCKGGLAPCKVAERKRPIGHTIARLQSIRGYIYIYAKTNSKSKDIYRTCTLVFWRWSSLIWFAQVLLIFLKPPCIIDREPSVSWCFHVLSGPNTRWATFWDPWEPKDLFTNLSWLKGRLATVWPKWSSATVWKSRDMRIRLNTGNVCC